MSRSFATALVLAALAVAAPLAGSVFEQRLPAAGIDTVSLTVKRGRVTVTAAADTMVSFTVEERVCGAAAAGQRVPFERSFRQDGARLVARFSAPADSACSVLVRLAVPAGLRVRIAALKSRLRLEQPAGPVEFDYISGELAAVGGSGRLVLEAWDDNGFNCRVEAAGAGDSLRLENTLNDVRLQFAPHLLVRLEASAGAKGTVDFAGLLTRKESATGTSWTGTVGTGDMGLGRAWVKVESVLDNIRVYGAP